MKSKCLKLYNISVILIIIGIVITSLFCVKVYINMESKLSKSSEKTKITSIDFVISGITIIK